MSWDELEPSFRRGQLTRSAFSIVVRTVLLITAFYLAPFENSGASSVAVRVLICLVIVGGAAALVVIGILRAEFPILRAIEGMTTLVVITILGFASIYALMSTSEPSTFSEPFNHTGALYFALTTATTIGFGDIAPKTDGARIVVMIQMTVNFVLLGVGVRLMINTAKRRARST